MPRAGLDRERVVDAAIAIADDEGLHAVSLARVAAALGVRPPSLYKHVDGRDALLRAIAVRSVRELTDALRAAAVELVLADVRQPVMGRMRRSGLLEKIGDDRIYLTVDEAVRGLAAPPPG